MTPKLRLSFLNISAFIGAVVAVVGLTSGAVRVGDHHYVRADTFTVYQQGQRENRKMDSLVHLRELSDIHRDIGDVKASLARVDSNTRCNRKRKPTWCAE